jgi:uncharacterized alpha-E superfamily protein
MLDPNNPRSVVYQLDRIEAHLIALPKHVADGRLSPPQQIAASVATKLRTADAATIEDSLIVDCEVELMRLSEATGTAYLTYNERSEAMWEALA